MTPKLLLDNFDVIANAKNGIPKLRQLILQLAVQGKLVKQDDGEQDVHHEEHEEHEGGKGKEKGKATPKHSFQIPATWRWTTLRKVSRDLGQKVPDKEFTYIDVSSIDKERGRIGEETQVLRPEDAPSRARKIVKHGTVIYSTVRPYLLNIAVVDRELAPAPIVSTAFFVMHPFDCVISRFLFYYLRSQAFTEYVNDAMTGMAYPAVNDSKMSVAPFPLPPLAEQKRIVAKVDELMARCDNLESRQNERHQRHAALVSSCLNSLSSPLKPETQNRKPPPSPLSPHPSSFPLHPSSLILQPSLFNLLFSSPKSIAELRKAILQLAVQGRLVRQDPREEKAEVLAARLRKQATSRKSALAPHESITNQKKPHPPLAAGWCQVRLGSFGQVLGGGTPSKAQDDLWKGDLPWVSPKDMKIPYLYDSEDHISTKALSESAVKLIPPRAILLVVRGMILAHTFPVAVNEVEVTINQDMKAIVPFDPETVEFLLLACRGYSDQILAIVERSSHGTCKLNTQKLFDIPIGLPPLAEQKRIVAKVDEIMAMCDKLEAKLAQSSEDAEKFTEAVVAVSYHTAIDRLLYPE